VFAALAIMAGPCRAAGTVQLNLIGDARGSALLFQEWAQVLGKAGIQNIRIRPAEDSDKLGIETLGAADQPIYVVTGILRSRDELLMPSGRFQRGDVGRLKQWLDDLAEHGPAAGKDSGKEEKAAFGLTPAQFDRIRKDLATPVGFATRGITCQRAVEKIAGRLKLPVKLDGDIARALADQTIGEELGDLSCGTALAYVLRSAGCGFLPRAAGNDVDLLAVNARKDLELWPVGWPAEESSQQRLPVMFEFLNVNVQNVSAAKAVEAIAKRMKTPALLDHAALARHGIDPAKAMVSLPRSRTTYSLALRRLLAKAGMKFEVRYDEAGAPLLWITSLKPS